MSDEQRYRNALTDIADHFDDQYFPHHKGQKDCSKIMVNFAIAVLNGYDGYMGEWYKERMEDK